DNLAYVLEELRKTLDAYPTRRTLVDMENPIQVWVCRGYASPSREEMRYQGQIGCLVARVERLNVLRLSYGSTGEIIDLLCASFSTPSVIQTNYSDLVREADRQRARLRPINSATK